MRQIFLSMIFLVPALPAYSAGTDTLNYNGIACLDADNITRGGKIGSSGDEEAYVKFFTKLIQSGECIMLEKGSTVFVEDVSLLSGMACVRPKGEPDCYNIEFEAIQGD